MNKDEKAVEHSDCDDPVGNLRCLRERGYAGRNQRGRKLVVGTQVSFAPFEFYFVDENGEEYAAGFEMELARQIAADLGVELEIADQQFAGLITALMAGEVDIVLAGMTATDERRQAVDFSETYYVGEQPFVVRAEDVEKYKTYDDIKGLVIGAQTGSIQQTIAEEQFPECELLLLPTVPTLLMELANGNVEAGALLQDRGDELI